MTAPCARLTRAAARAGVSEGGPKSGDLARAVATAALQRAERCEGSIRAEFQETPLQGSDVCSVLHKAEQASTTVTIARMHNGDCNHMEVLKFGDSQCAVIRKVPGKGPSQEFVCVFLSKPTMYMDRPNTPLQLDIRRNLPYFLTHRVSESNVWNEVAVQEDDFLILASDGFWDNFNDGYGFLSREQMMEKIPSFFKENYLWWASNTSNNESFVNFIGRAMRHAVVHRMSGPHSSSTTNKRTNKADDVSFYLGTLQHDGDEDLSADSSKEVERSLLADDKLSHLKISQGVEYNSTTTREYLKSLFVQKEIKQVEDRFEGYKVDMCRHKGYCHRDDCVFAHDESELRCLRWTRHGCAGGCGLKHSTDDAEVARKAIDKMRTYKANQNRANFGRLERGRP